MLLQYRRERLLDVEGSVLAPFVALEKIFNNFRQIYDPPETRVGAAEEPPLGNGLGMEDIGQLEPTHYLSDHY